MNSIQQEESQNKNHEQTGPMKNLPEQNKIKITAQLNQYFIWASLLEMTALIRLGILVV